MPQSRRRSPRDARRYIVRRTTYRVRIISSAGSSRPTCRRITNRSSAPVGDGSGRLHIRPTAQAFEAVPRRTDAAQAQRVDRLRRCFFALRVQRERDQTVRIGIQSSRLNTRRVVESSPPPSRDRPECSSKEHRGEGEPCGKSPGRTDDAGVPLRLNGRIPHRNEVVRLPDASRLTTTF
jgi:hypothetical protein